MESVLISSGTDQVVPVFQTLADAVCSVCEIDGDDDEIPGRALVFSLDAERTQAGVARVGAWVDELCILLNLSGRTEYALRLCLEEVVTQVVLHAPPEPGGNADRVALRLIADSARLSITVQDHCAAYNPLLEQQGTAAAIDGIGISLLRQHARDLGWSRTGQSNRVAFTIPR